MTYFHFLQLGLSMSKGLVGGGALPKSYPHVGLGMGRLCWKPQEAAEEPRRGWAVETLSHPQRAPAASPSWLQGREDCWGPHQWPLPLTSFEIRNDTQLSKMYL